MTVGHGGPVRSGSARAGSVTPPARPPARRWGRRRAGCRGRGCLARDPSIGVVLAGRVFSVTVAAVPASPGLCVNGSTAAAAVAGPGTRADLGVMQTAQVSSTVSSQDIAFCYQTAIMKCGLIRSGRSPEIVLTAKIVDDFIQDVSKVIDKVKNFSTQL